MEDGERRTASGEQTLPEIRASNCPCQAFFSLLYSFFYCCRQCHNISPWRCDGIHVVASFYCYYIYLSDLLCVLCPPPGPPDPIDFVHILMGGVGGMDVEPLRLGDACAMHLNI